jgi:hypothetical protein
MSSYTAAMKAIRTLLLATACALPVIAAAQWQWIGPDGRKVFSDRPPPADIAPSKILKQPGIRAAAVPPAEPAEAAASGSANTKTAAASPRPNASAPKLSGKDKELEDKKKQADAAEAEKKKAEEAKIAQLKETNCADAKRSKAAFDSGVRIARTNAKGETEYLDDQQRAAQQKRLQDIIARDCK